MFLSLTSFDRYLMDITVIHYSVLSVTVGNDPEPEQVNNMAIDD
jgi:hypothetical protein